MTTTEYGQPIEVDVAGQIQRVANRRALGNRLVVAPVTYWSGHFTTETVWFVSNTYPPVEAVIVSVDEYSLGDFDRVTHRAFTIEITGSGDFYRTGERIDRVAPTQVKARRNARTAHDDEVQDRISAERLAAVKAGR